MQRRTSFQRIVLIVSLGAIAFFLIDAFLARAQITSNPIEETFSAIAPHAPRLIIPRIHVNASVERVGLTSDGVMEAPKKPAHVGLFDSGPRPGEIGSAVIDGHFGWKDGMPAVFDELSRLHVGDKIYFKEEKGSTIAFIVREVKVYEAHENASSVFASNDGKAHLNLITCEGTWNKASQNYSDRLVVFADKVVE